jgi:hypothetical protein
VASRQVPMVVLFRNGLEQTRVTSASAEQRAALSTAEGMAEALHLG